MVPHDGLPDKQRVGRPLHAVLYAPEDGLGSRIVAPHAATNGKTVEQPHIVCVATVQSPVLLHIAPGGFLVAIHQRELGHSVQHHLLQGHVAHPLAIIERHLHQLSAALSVACPVVIRCRQDLRLYQPTAVDGLLAGIVVHCEDYGGVFRQGLASLLVGRSLGGPVLCHPFVGQTTKVFHLI